MLSVAFAALAAAVGLAVIVEEPPKYPYPQDCSNIAYTKPPSWFKDCDSTVGGCFALTVPSLDTLFSVGNTSRTTCDSTGHCDTGAPQPPRPPMRATRPTDQAPAHCSIWR